MVGETGDWVARTKGRNRDLPTTDKSRALRSCSLKLEPLGGQGTLGPSQGPDAERRDPFTHCCTLLV